MAKVATSASGWSKLILMIAVPLTAIGVLRMIFVKEKYKVDAEQADGEKLKVKDIGVVLKTNKYILIIALMTFVFNFVYNMGVQCILFYICSRKCRIDGSSSRFTGDFSSTGACIPEIDREVFYD